MQRKGQYQSEQMQSLSATNLATHHHLKCDLFLRNVYHSSPANYRRSTANTSELTEAQFKRGIDWEDRLLSWLDERGQLYRDTERKGALTADDFRAIINKLDDRNHFYMAGLSFMPPQDAFEHKFVQAGTSPVAFGLFKPDLIEINRTQTGTVIWRVIDAKSSKDVKVIFRTGDEPT
jgi:hypothetical protein